MTNLLPRDALHAVRSSHRARFVLAGSLIGAVLGVVVLLGYLCIRVGEVSACFKALFVSTVGLFALLEILVFRYRSEYLKKIKTHPDIKT